MKYYSDVKYYDIMKFAGKLMELLIYHPELGIPDPERQTWYVPAYMWILAIKSTIEKLQSIEPQRLALE